MLICLSTHRSATEWNLLFALLSATAQEEEAAKISMEFLRHLASGRLGAKLSGDNYAAFLQTLAAFGHIVRSSMNEYVIAVANFSHRDKSDWILSAATSLRCREACKSSTSCERSKLRFPI